MAEDIVVKCMYCETEWVRSMPQSVRVKCPSCRKLTTPDLTRLASKESGGRRKVCTVLGCDTVLSRDTLKHGWNKCSLHRAREVSNRLARSSKPVLEDIFRRR